jgi:hypothetical protein
MNPLLFSHVADRIYQSDNFFKQPYFYKVYFLALTNTTSSISDKIANLVGLICGISSQQMAVHQFLFSIDINKIGIDWLKLCNYYQVMAIIICSLIIIKKHTDIRFLIKLFTKFSI